MLNHVRTAAFNVLSQIGGIAPESLNVIKTSTLKVRSGTPETMGDATGLLGKTIVLSRQAQEKRLSQIGKPLTEARDERATDIDSERPAMVYQVKSGTITASPASFLPTSFFGTEAPAPANYGALGVLMARAIVVDVLKNQTKAMDNLVRKVETSAAPLIKKDNIGVTPANLAGQVIPDLLAIKIAHLAMRASLAESGKKSASSTDQLFFGGFASLLRQKIKPQVEARIKKADFKILTNAERVDLTAYLSREFQIAFGTTKGDRLFNELPVSLD
jgi:predicted metalloendopeptidase